MRAIVIASVIAAGSAIGLAGCGGTDRAAQPTGASATQAASPIPPTKNPRDVAVMGRRPCELLTPQQAAGFGLNLPPHQTEGVLDRVGCQWISNTPDRRVYRRVDLSTFTNNLTLEAVYNRRESLPFFELTEISGYPATVSRTNADVAHCDIDVKPAERQSFSVIYDSHEFDNNPQQACAVGKQVAAAVLMNLPPKG